MSVEVIWPTILGWNVREQDLGCIVHMTFNAKYLPSTFRSHPSLLHEQAISQPTRKLSTEYAFRVLFRSANTSLVI